MLCDAYSTEIHVSADVLGGFKFTGQTIQSLMYLLHLLPFLEVAFQELFHVPPFRNPHPKTADPDESWRFHRPLMVLA